MKLAESTSLGAVSYLVLVMGVTAPKAKDMLKELETSGLVTFTTNDKLELKVLEDNHETH